MIKSLHISDPADTPVKWWNDVEALRSVKRFDFTSGVNIIWGPNGIGKSTVILALARLTHCEQGGRSVVTSTSVEHFRRDRYDWKKEIRRGMRIDFDGQPVVYRNPHSNVGLIGGMAGFDEDFFKDAMSSIKRRKLSSGQQALDSFRIERPDKIERRLRNRSLTDIADRLDVMLKPTIGKGPETTLWDEPDANLDWPTRSEFWHMMTASPQQHIVATHSHFALRLFARSNIIELQPGYRDECQKVLEDWGLWK